MSAVHSDWERRVTRYPDAERPRHERLLLAATTMAEIREAAALLGMTFREAYAERAELFKRRWQVWPTVYRWV